jgi:nitric oxide reductase NorQ protein
MLTHKVVRQEPREDFVMTPQIEAVCRRARTYLDAGYACHFRGAAGTGKTTIAMHVAGARGRPVALMFGDDAFDSSDLVGREKGLHSTKVTDNFVRNVTKTEEFRRAHWVDSGLTTACRHGHTLVYDEFSRSRPEANNVLLTILEERVLSLPDGQDAGPPCVRVHPDFRAIFTSNPDDYAGVHKTQNALLDRMVTIELDFYDRETEAAITASRAGVDAATARLVVDLVREVRAVAATHRPTLRASIMIARILRQLGGITAASTPLFADACVDVLHPESAGSDGAVTAARRAIRSVVDSVRQP